MKPAPWNTEENRSLVALYFTMLDAAKTGLEYNKAGMIRHARGESVGAWMTKVEHGSLSARSRGSIEAKLMNCSAAHRDIDPEAETMATHGYKAWGNYQKHLKDCINDELQNRQFEADAQTSQANEQRAGA